MIDQLPPVRADRQQLQVVLDLLDNARRYTQAGSVHIRASTSTTMWCRSISPTPAQAFRAKNSTQLFTRFHRVEGNSSPERGGGLGLAIARQLIERQGGRVWAESTPGQGSTFWALHYW